MYNKNIRLKGYIIMAKEKLDKKILENNNFEAIMIGLMMILISAIGLIGKGPVGEFL